jgi:tetratricopeptide (TPR) repeat protein
MRRKTTISVLIGWLLVSIPGSYGQPTSTSFTVEDYADVVHHYLRGDSIRAGHRLYQVPREQVQEASKDYRQGWLTESQLKAAALLHTHLALSAGQLESFNLETARAFLRRIEDDSRRKSFLKQWYLAVGYTYYSTLRLSDADVCFQAAVQSFPDDSDLLLAQGSLIECSAWMLGDETALGVARQAFDRLIRKDSNHAEARLRLGHIMLLWGQMQQKASKRPGPEKSPRRKMHREAYQEINRVLERTNEGELLLVANLLLGDIYKDRGEVSRAIESYRAAAEIDPYCQAASVALSHALRLNGGREASREVMRHFLKVTARDPVELDGWWRFLLGRSLLAETILKQMGEEMRQ